jgi:hypothetical protein
MIMMYDMIYYGLNARCISIYMCLNGTEHMYTLTAKTMDSLFHLYGCG